MKHGLFFFNYVILTPILCLKAVITIWARNVLKLDYIKVQLLVRRIIEPNALLLLKICTVVTVTTNIENVLRMYLHTAWNPSLFNWFMRTSWIIILPSEAL